LDRDKYPEKAFFEFISLISCELFCGSKGEKLTLFVFSAGTKGEL
jgi:hypothetical protein